MWALDRNYIGCNTKKMSYYHRSVTEQNYPAWTLTSAEALYREIDLSQRNLKTAACMILLHKLQTEQVGFYSFHNLESARKFW